MRLRFKVFVWVKGKHDVAMAWRKMICMIIIIIKRLESGDFVWRLTSIMKRETRLALVLLVGLNCVQSAVIKRNRNCLCGVRQESKIETRLNKTNLIPFNDLIQHEGYYKMLFYCTETRTYVLPRTRKREVSCANLIKCGRWWLHIDFYSLLQGIG